MRLVRTALTIGVLTLFGWPRIAEARASPPGTTKATSPGRLLYDVPSPVRNLLPLPLYGVPRLFVAEPHFTKTGSTLQTAVAVWKDSDEELVARDPNEKPARAAPSLFKAALHSEASSTFPPRFQCRDAGLSVSKRRAPKSPSK